jgi:hypothetical protein
VRGGAFRPAPVEEDEDANVVWSGYNWTIHGASGVIGQVLKHLVYDERMLERLQRLDTSVAVAQTVVHSLVQLAATTKEGETGAKYAAVRPLVPLMTQSARAGSSSN